MSQATKSYRAEWIWAEPGRLLKDAVLVTNDAGIVEVVEHPAPGHEAQDLGRGLIIPGLVNAHTHLELSGLAGVAEPQGDFVDWLLQLVRERPQQDPAQAAEATRRAVQQAAETGTALVGDVTNTGRAMQALAEQGLSAVLFFEALGPAMAEPPDPAVRWIGSRLEQSAVAAHSPYSVPSWRIKALKERAGQGPFCMHLAESEAEVQYLAGSGEQGRRLDQFLNERNVSRDDLALEAFTPLAIATAAGAMDRSTLLVHCVQFTDQECQRVAEAGASVCVCPRSNLRLTRRIGPVPNLLELGVNLALGTDSLASTVDLSLWGEMAALLQYYPKLDPEAVLTMATLGGARALGQEDRFGRLRPGMLGRPVLVPLDGYDGPDVLAAALDPRNSAQARALP